MYTDKRKTIVLGALLLAAAFALKWWYRTATVEQLGFVLTPVATFISLLTGASHSFVPGQGHLFPDLGILIDRSCSGVNFLIIATASFTFQWLRRADAGCARPILVIIIGIGAWVLTMLANTGRILSMVHLEKLGAHLGPTAHEALGAFFFLATLLLASLALDRLLAHHRNAHVT